MITAKTLITTLSFLAFVSARPQTETSTASGPITTDTVSTCVFTCLNGSAIQAGCTDYSDTKCVCSSSAFLDSATTCVQLQCPFEDFQPAQQLQQQECAGSSSATLSLSSTTSSTISSPTATSTSITTHISSASTSSASGTTNSSKPASSGSASTSSAAASHIVSAGAVPSNAAMRVAARSEKGVLYSLGAVVLGFALGPWVL